VTEQDENAGTYHRTSDFDELCELDPNEEVQIKEFLDRLRALTFPPYDNAKIQIDGETYYIEVKISQ
jgi:methionyl-tRNA formyltransferase